MENKIIVISLILVLIFTLAVTSAQVDFGKFSVDKSDIDSFNKVMDGKPYKLCNLESGNCVLTKEVK